MLTKHVLLGLSLLSSTLAAALPATSPNSVTLFKRSNTYTGCDDAQKKKVGQALADMATLAMWGNTLAKTDDLGYSHYFQKDEITVFKKAMDVISQNNDPTNAPYKFVINCTPTGDEKKKCDKRDSPAITDARKPKSDDDHLSIWICPLFFEPNTDSARDLPDTNDKAALKEFCDQDSYRKFPTAGHVLLHEITHLDAVAKLFPLDADKEGKHGTLDYEVSSSPIADARRLKVRIDGGQKELQAPIYTAESYAGAATELWFEKFCPLDFIPPKKGYE